VNANNDNGSPWVAGTSDTIPSVRDFNFPDANHPGPLAAPDPQLAQINVGIFKDDGTGGNAGVLGTLSIAASSSGAGEARVWSDNVKTAAFQPVHVKFGGQGWIEGTHESRPEGDVTISVDFAPDDQQTNGGPVHFTRSVTITPVARQFSIQPATLPNVYFVNGNDASGGLKAGKPATKDAPGVPGATFSADVVDLGIYDGTPGKRMDFVQNMPPVENGIGGRGWEFSDDTHFMSLVLTSGDFPILDTVTGSTPPYYGPEWRQPAGDAGIWTAKDSPGTGFPPNSQNTLLVNVTYSFALYLVCRYTDGSIWPVANTTGSVKFHSTMHFVLDDSRVTWTGATNYDNTLPQKLIPPVFNDSAEWAFP
jgi:hypothetical protein